MDLASPQSAQWLRDARHNCAEVAKEHAVQMLVAGDHEAFRMQLREAVLLNPAFCWSFEQSTVSILVHETEVEGVH